LAAAGTPIAENTALGQRYASPEEAEVLELGVKMRLPYWVFKCNCVQTRDKRLSVKYVRQLRIHSS
jgi:hypothetical protein